MNTLKAEKRSTDEKAKKLRREGFVTGNLFGREIENSIMLKLSKKDVEQLLKVDNKGSQVMLEVDGQTYDTLIKEVDFNPLAGRVDEIDFQALVSNEKVHSVAEIVIVNHDKVADGVLQENMEEVNYKAYPSALVDKVEVDVAGLKVGDTIRVKDLSLAKDKDIDIKDDPEAVVLTVVAVHNGAVPETETPEEAETEEAK